MWLPKSECVFICRLRLVFITLLQDKGKNLLQLPLVPPTSTWKCFYAFTLLHLDELDQQHFASGTSRVKISGHHTGLQKWWWWNLHVHHHLCPLSRLPICLSNHLVGDIHVWRAIMCILYSLAASCLPYDIKATNQDRSTACSHSTQQQYGHPSASQKRKPIDDLKTDQKGKIMSN